MSRTEAARRPIGPDDCRACRGTGQVAVHDGPSLTGFEDCAACGGTGAKRKERLERPPEEEEL